MPDITLDAIGLVAQSMAVTLEFYRRLGVPFPAEADAETHAEAPLGEGIRLMVDTEESMRGFNPNFDGAPGDRVAFAARLATPQDVDAVYAELAADGYGLTPPWDAPWQMRYATLRDPDGVHVDLYAVQDSS